ncbi:MAG: hypothetical protein HYZ75_05370 [Elusimicrobia bacterium]|nr:hypothetical protein [Elusimicrobiota bacterium]
MRALILMLAAVGVTLLVFWFWREQMRGKVEPTPAIVEQLEDLISRGVFEGRTPGSVVATLVFSEPFKEADPWDSAPKKRTMMNAWFGEPRELAFLQALGREEAFVTWRLDSTDSTDLVRAEAEAASAAAWAAAKGMRLRVIAHGGAIDPVLRAALTFPGPPFERLLGVGVSLGDIKARDPELAQALFDRLPAEQWLNLYSNPAVVPRSLMLESVGLGLTSRAEETARPGRSWVPTVTGLAKNGVSEAGPSLPMPSGAALMSARQFRSVKDGRITQRVVDGKGHLVTGSLIVPKLDREEIPPDPEAGQKKSAAALDIGPRVPVGTSGWTFRAHAEFSNLTGRQIDCAGGATVLVPKEVGYWIVLQCRKPPFDAAKENLGDACRGRPQYLSRLTFKGNPAAICKQSPVAGKSADGAGSDVFQVLYSPYIIEIRYNYPSLAAREARLDQFMRAIESLDPPGAMTK